MITGEFSKKTLTCHRERVLKRSNFREQLGVVPVFEDNWGLFQSRFLGYLYCHKHRKFYSRSMITMLSVPSVMRTVTFPVQ